jgi:hypothetical protein
MCVHITCTESEREKFSPNLKLVIAINLHPVFMVCRIAIKASVIHIMSIEEAIDFAMAFYDTSAHNA